jgi:hypothetical protein
MLYSALLGGSGAGVFNSEAPNALRATTATAREESVNNNNDGAQNSSRLCKPTAVVLNQLQQTQAKDSRAQPTTVRLVGFMPTGAPNTAIRGFQ